MSKQYLILNTSSPTFRSFVWGWGCCDPKLIDPKKDIGLSPNWQGSYPAYSCVAFALAAGWELLGPPQRDIDDKVNSYSWWLVKTVEE